MSIKESREIARRFTDECWDKSDVQVLARIIREGVDSGACASRFDRTGANSTGSGARH